jgi:hypothetical protein
LIIKPTKRGVSTSNSNKAHTKLLEDDVLFKVGKEWVAEAEADAPVEDSATH